MKPIVGSFLIMLGLFMLMGFFASTHPRNIGADISLLLLFVVLPLGGGSYMLYSHFKAKQQLQKSKAELSEKTLDSAVLKLAMAKQGKLTAVELMTAFSLSLPEAQKTLDDLALKGLADYEVTDSGMMVYSFHDIQHLNEKGLSKDILDA